MSGTPDKTRRIVRCRALPIVALSGVWLGRDRPVDQAGDKARKGQCVQGVESRTLFEEKMRDTKISGTVLQYQLQVISQVINPVGASQSGLLCGAKGRRLYRVLFGVNHLVIRIILDMQNFSVHHLTTKIREECPGFVGRSAKKKKKKKKKKVCPIPCDSQCTISIIFGQGLY